MIEEGGEEDESLNPAAGRRCSWAQASRRAAVRVASSSQRTAMPQSPLTISMMLRMRLMAMALASLSGERE